MELNEPRKDDPIVKIHGWCYVCHYFDKGVAKLSHLQQKGWQCPRCQRATLVLTNAEA